MSGSSNSSHDSALYFAYSVLLSSAVLPIYTSSFSSLKTPKSTKLLLKSQSKRRSKRLNPDSDSDSEQEDDEEESTAETLTSSDAYLFPVFGSFVLFGLYLVFKFIDPSLINTLVTAYFAVVGFLAISKVSTSLSKWAVGSSTWYQVGGKWKLRLEKNKKSVSRLSFSLLSIPPLFFSLVVILCYVFYDRPWPLSNLLALSLAHNAIALISLDSFVTGSILLAGLFLYDIFWVFGTDVMVSVARQFEAPVKIVFPKNLLPVMNAYLNGDLVPKWQLTLLGLGDIVIPGVFVALALRFDQHLASSSSPSINFTKHYRSFPKPYFKSTLSAYILGLATTMAVMHFFKKAQPALLYLSPACIFAVLITAWMRGEMKEAWEWSDGETEEEAKERSEKEEEKEKEKNSKSKRIGNGSGNGKEGKHEDEDGFEDEDEDEGDASNHKNGTTPSGRSRKTSVRRRSSRRSSK